ncbi:MAG: Asp/Glu racemase, partial [Dehalococcoidia bacterium]
MSDSYRIGLIVPSSNTTMETEIPAMLRRRELVA